jgi:hypothetical protein
MPRAVYGWCALAVETHEGWLEGMRYLNMEHLREHKKEVLRQAAAELWSRCAALALMASLRGSSAHPHTMNLLNLTHTTRACITSGV